MYSWSEDTSDWYGSGSYSYGEAGSEVRSAAASAAAVAGPRTYGGKSGPNVAMIDPHKRITTQSANPVVVAVDVTGSMANWPFEIFDRLPLLYNTLSQYREDVEICFAAIGDASWDRWPLQVTEFAHGYDLEQQLNALYGEGGGGDAPESYGLFAWWVENHVTTPRANRPFLIVFGDAPMHETIPRAQIERLLGDRPNSGGLLDRIFGNGADAKDLNAVECWRRLAAVWNVWFLRRPTGRRGDEVDRQWSTALGADHVFRIDDEQRAVDYAMGLIARSWGRFEDFQSNLRARQDESKVKTVAEKIRREGPRVLQCPSCGARLPAEAMGRYVCTYCHSTLEL
jgi:ribosomal protein S27AE